jgi:hypothetical protein
MNPKALQWLKLVMWGVCAFHVIVGIGLNVSPAFPKAMAGYYGATVAWSPEFLYIIKPLGAFMLVMGVLAAVAATNPLKNTPIIYGFVLLFVLRTLQRVIHQGELLDIFGIPAKHNVGNMVFFAGLALTLFLLLRAARGPGLK